MTHQSDENNAVNAVDVLLSTTVIDAALAARINSGDPRLVSLMMLDPMFRLQVLRRMGDATLERDSVAELKKFALAMHKVGLMAAHEACEEASKPRNSEAVGLIGAALHVANCCDTVAFNVAINSSPEGNEDGMGNQLAANVERDRLRGMIKAAMHAKGWSQADLARAAELPKYTVSRVIRGESAMTQLVAKKLAKALNIDDPAMVGAPVDSNENGSFFGLWNSRLPDGTSDLRFSGNVQQGISVLIEALVNHRKPITTSQLAKILTVLAAE